MTASLRSESGRDGSVVDRLLKSSARHSYDPEIDIDWSAPIPADLWGMQPEKMSLYGTHLWDQLSHEQRLELSRHEVASIASVGLWFEVILMQMMLRDVYDDDPTGAHMHYALTEVADECRHSTMFGKSIAHFGIPAYGPQPQIFKLGRLFKHIAYGPSAYGGILVAEEILDTWQRDLMKDERVQPVTRMVARIHVLEEARHMTFAREEVERRLQGMSKARLGYHQVVLGQVVFMLARALVNPEIYAAVGIDPREGRRAALGNPHYRETMRWMGEKPIAFLREQGLIPRHQEKVWRGSLLLG